MNAISTKSKAFCSLKKYLLTEGICGEWFELNKTK